MDGRADLEFFRDLGVEDLFLDSPAPAGSSSVSTGSMPDLAALSKLLEGCPRCKLSKGRTNIVFGQGNPKAELLFVGEAPGRDEDEQGLAFVGRAGQLLTKIIEAMGYRREQVYIANVIKCRPPNNRNPEPDEVAACRPFLEEQIRLIAPRSSSPSGLSRRRRSSRPTSRSDACAAGGAPPGGCGSCRRSIPRSCSARPSARRTSGRT